MSAMFSKFSSTHIFNLSTIDEFEFNAPESILLEESKEPENLFQGTEKPENFPEDFIQKGDTYVVSAEYEGLSSMESKLLEGTENPENLPLQALGDTKDKYDVDEYKGLRASDSILLEVSKEPENLLLQDFRRNGNTYGVSAEYEGLSAMESKLLEGTDQPENLPLQALGDTRDKYGVDEYEGLRSLRALEGTIEGSTDPGNLSLQVLRHITNNFSEDQIIGRGGCAVVYKGILSNGRLVAVKKFYSHYTIEDKQFDQEVQSFIRAQHKNIVRFLGYCSHTEKRAVKYKGSIICADIRESLLCFEYISNGTLQKHLNGTRANI